MCPLLGRPVILAAAGHGLSVPLMSTVAIAAGGSQCFTLAANCLFNAAIEAIIFRPGVRARAGEYQSVGAVIIEAINRLPVRLPLRKDHLLDNVDAQIGPCVVCLILSWCSNAIAET